MRTTKELLQLLIDKILTVKDQVWRYNGCLCDLVIYLHSIEEITLEERYALANYLSNNRPAGEQMGQPWFELRLKEPRIKYLQQQIEKL